MELDLLYAHQGLNNPAKDAQRVEDHLPAFIHQGASNINSDHDLKDNMEPLDPRVKKLIRTYLEVFWGTTPSSFL